MSLGYSSGQENSKDLGYFKKDKSETSISRYVQFKLPEKESLHRHVKNTEVTKTPDYNIIKNLKDVFPIIVEIYPQLTQKEIKEPEPTPQKAKYQRIVVRETHSGHVFIQDDTKGNRRVITQHASGTYQAMLDDGTQVIHITKDGIEITERDSKIYIQRNRLTLIDGNDWIQVKKNKTAHVNQNEFKVIDVDKKTKIGKNEKREIGKNQEIIVGENITIKAGKDIKVNAEHIYLNC